MDLDWFITFRDPAEIWKNHPSYLVAEITLYICAALTAIHALRAGGRYCYLWLSTLFHGLTVEIVSYFLPDIDNFWHAQSMVMFLGKRLPLHIILAYPFFIYPASVAAHNMNLKRWAIPFATGLCVVLIDIPFDIVGIKQLWWTWHDTDPNIFDRMYWVPWTSYYFHASFASGLTFLFLMTRKVITGNCDMSSCSGVIQEMICCIITGLFSMGFGIIQFIPIYHPLHDLLNIHTEVCVKIFLSIFVLIVFTSRTNQSNIVNKGGNRILLCMVMISNLSMFLVTYFMDPTKIKSIGLHEEIGPCHLKTDVQTPIGKVLQKSKYLCISNYDEDYFDFHCLSSKELPSNGSSWYTVCGTQYSNKMEYLIIISVIGLLSTIFFSKYLQNSPNIKKDSKKFYKKYN